MQADALMPTTRPVALACLNCGAALSGPFCAACGQSAATPEHVTFRALWTDFRVNKLGLDRGFFVTVRDVLLRPGVVATAFVEGRRRTYVHPLTFLFVAYGLYAVVFGLVEGPMMAGMADAMSRQVADVSGLSAHARAEAVTAGVASMRFAVSYGAYLSILTVLPFGVLLQRFLPASGRTVAECAVFALTVEAGVALVAGVVLNPLVAWTGSVALSLLSFVLYFALTGVGAAVFFDRRAQTLARALAAQGLALVLFMTVQGLAGAAFGVLLATKERGM